MPYITPAGYMPANSMPAIPAPPSGDPTTYYNGLGLTVTATDLGADGVTFEVSGGTLDLLSLSGGLVYYVPGGDPLPDGTTISPGQGSVVLQTHLPDLDGLRDLVPPGTPYMSYSMLLNATAASVQTALTPLLPDMPDAILDATWNETEPTPASGEPRAVKEAKYLDRVMSGERSLFIEGGTKVGEADLNTSGKNEFTLAFGLGSPANNSYVPVSPVLLLRRLPDFDDPQWTDHPFITATASITPPLDIYVKFEVFDPSTSAYVPVDSGATVELMDCDSNGASAVPVANATTNANGAVQFNFATPPSGTYGKPNYFFRIQSPSATIFEQDGVTPITLPATWQTKENGNGTEYWESVEGERGFFPDFEGSLLGDPDVPLTYRVGLDFHVELGYEVIYDPWGAPKDYGAQDRAHRGQTHFVTLGTLIKTHTGGASGAPIEPISDPVYAGPPFPVVHTGRMPSGGTFSQLIFSIEPGEDIFWGAYFDIENSDINLQHTLVTYPDPPVWMTSYWQTSYKYKNNRRPTIGKPGIPESFICWDTHIGKSLDYLHNLSEFSYVLYHLTNGASLEWPGLQLTYRSWITSAFSWPIGTVNISDSKWNRFSRDTLVHETAHQVYWWAANYSSASIAWEALFQNIKLSHRLDKLANEEHAIVEGWAEFWAGIMIGIVHKVAEVRENSLFTWKSVGPPPNDRGQKVEGLFAAALTEIFYEEVVTSNPARFFNSSGKMKFTNGKQSFAYWGVQESYDGDPTVLSNNAWLLDANVQSRFIDIIWKPANDLDNTVQDTSTSEFIDNMLNASANAAIAHRLRGLWQAQNLAVDEPSFTSITPQGGPTASTTNPTNVTIAGAKFSSDDSPPHYRTSKVSIQFNIGGTYVTDVNVVSSSQITAVFPPKPAGTYSVDLVLFVRGAPAHTVTLPNAITYA